MPYYGLFSLDLHILDLQWRSPWCSLLFWILSLCALLVRSMTHYDITMGHDVVRDAPLWHNKDNNVARDIHYDITMDNDVAMYT